MFWRSVAIRLWCPTIGALAAFAVLPAIIELVGLGELERVRLLGERVDQLIDSQDDAGAILLVGNSVAIEGLDAERVREAAGAEQPVRNYAINGSRLPETAAMLPRLLQTRPSAVVFVLMPTHLVETREATPDEDAAYAMSGLVDSDLTGAEAITHFRTAPLRSLDDRLRMQLASGRRSGAAADWSCPNLLTADAPPVARENHLARVRELLTADRSDGELRDRIALIERMAADCERAGAAFLLCEAPIHPALRDDAVDLAGFDPPTDSLRFVDLLAEAEFADAVHPNAAGRIRFSEAMGASLGRLRQFGTVRLAGGE